LKGAAYNRRPILSVDKAALDSARRHDRFIDLLYRNNVFRIQLDGLPPESAPPMKFDHGLK
jgi:hypothetical protein